MELTEVDHWPQDKARCAATKEEGATQVRRVQPRLGGWAEWWAWLTGLGLPPQHATPDPETDNCIVHDLSSHSRVQQRPCE